MGIWVGQDGSYNDDDGDGAASLDDAGGDTSSPSPYDDADRNPALMNFLDIPSTINEEIPVEVERQTVVHDVEYVPVEASAPPFEVAPELPLLDVEPAGGAILMPGPVPVFGEEFATFPPLGGWPHRHHHHHHHWPWHTTPPVPHPHRVPSVPLPMHRHPRSPCPPGMVLGRDGKCHVPRTHASGEFTGWTEPFTDWDGDLLEGMGQYGVYDITEPWYPADFAAIPYPPEYEPEPAEHEEATPSQTQQPATPLETPAAPAAPTPPHFGPPPSGKHTRRAGGGASRPGTVARGTFTGFDFPFTDDNGELLTDPHPSHRDWPQPMTYGDPVMTGWDAPLTDLEGQLLSGPGQYGTFQRSNPWDHRTFDDVDLASPQLEGDAGYYYTDANMYWPESEYFASGPEIVGDDGAAIGQALGSAFGSAMGDNSGSWGQAGSQIATSIEQGADSGDWGSALASIGTAAAKVAIPAIVKATQGSNGSSASTSSTSSPASTTTPSTSTPSSTATRSARADRNPALRKLMALVRQLAPKYNITIPHRTPGTTRTATHGVFA